MTILLAHATQPLVDAQGHRIATGQLYCICEGLGVECEECAKALMAQGPARSRSKPSP